MICSETSPRVSFSHDLSQEEELKESRRDTMLLDSCSDFEFNICGNREQTSSSADELFANGMILPVMFQDKQLKMVQRCQVPVPVTVTSLPPRPKLSTAEDWKKENMKQIRPVSSDMEEKKTRQSSKSIWGFNRSSSLKCDKKKSLIFSLPLLSRSNSTGSVPNPKRSNSKDVTNKHSSSKSGCNSNQFQQKPFLKKKHGSCHGNGVRVSPVLNVPPYIPKGTVNLFGLGSFLCNGRDKKSKKWSF